MSAAMSDLRAPAVILLPVIWLTRIGGALFVLGGIGFFVLAWNDRSVIPFLMGFVPLAFGVVCMSVRRTQEGGLEYGLFRRSRRKS